MLKAIFVLSVTVFSCSASAYFQQDLLNSKKTKENAAAQWTLADWLSQKKKISLMDQWLATHRTTHWFALNLSGAEEQFTFKTVSNTANTSTDQTAQDYQADTYFSIFNINGEYQKSNDSRESFGGAAGFQILGANSQTTGLVVRYGVRRLSNLSTEEHWQNPYAEGALQLYIVSAFGLTGQYRYYFSANSNLGNSMIGHKVLAGAFFELASLRIYADYFQEPLTITTAGVESQQTSDGFQGGLKLFF